MEWKHFIPPLKKKFGYQPRVERVIITVFRDIQEPILEHYQERGVTISSAHYSEMLYTSQSERITVNTKDSCQKVLCCCVSVAVPILLPTLLKLSSSYALRSYNIHHTAQTLLVRFLSVWTPQRYFKRPSFCQ
jgi:hypothetical protein